MAKISELSGEEREKRIAELKAKMQAAAERAKAAHEAGGSPAPSAPAPAKPEPAASAPAAAAEATTAPVATAEAEAEAEPAEAPKTRPVREVAPTAGNGASPKPAAKPAPKPHPPAAPPEPPPSPQDMTRREFITYAWGATLGLLAVQGGVVSFMFMYPRFRAGEFGGKFFLGPQSGLPAPDAAPVANTTGKFWLVSTEEGDPRALYMVCTHLGCLYKWEASNGRFECPCHGSKFTHDGHYIEGPAPRSLDMFEITIEGDQVVVDTGARITGGPASESPARAAV